MKTILYLARHGETFWNKVQRFQGHLDSDLTRLGEQQSEKIATALIQETIDLVITSPLGRAIATAKVCQKSLQVEMVLDDGLIERNLGVWQGQCLNDIALEPNYDEILHHFTDVSPVGGESSQACGQRIFSTFKAIVTTHQAKKILAIFHGEALRCFLLFIGQQLDGNAYKLFKNGTITKVSYCHDKATFQLL